MKVIKPKNSKFNKWYLKKHPFASIDKSGELLTSSRVDSLSSYYDEYAAYEFGKDEVYENYGY